MKYSSDYLELANYYREQGNEDMALKIVLKGLEKCTGRLDGIYQYLFDYYCESKDEASLEQLYRNAEKRNRDYDFITELMYQHYNEIGNYEKKKKTLKKLILCCDTRKLYKYYNKCKTEFGKEDFEKEEKKILNTIKERKLYVYFDILIDKGKTREVVEYITQNVRSWVNNIDQDHYFSKRLESEYPREIVEMYWKEAQAYVSFGKENYYRQAVSVLKDIKRIMKKNKWSDEWNRRYAEFLTEHKRKRLLLGLLENFKA